MQIYDRLADGNPFAVGDSNMLNHSEKVEVLQKRERFQAFQAKLRKLCDGDEEYLPFQLKLRDPLGNSFFSARLGSFVPPECDPCLHTEDYERSFDDNEEFGLNDMNTRDFETGVDYDEVILADRLTHVSVKGPDHPHEFAKGAPDPTPGGVYRGKLDSAGQAIPGTNYLESTQTAETARKTETGADVIPEGASMPDDGWVINHDDYPKRVFNDDSALAFTAHEEFAGAKPGQVFRLGSLGLGYYEDTKKEKM
jgi:hypothetical protein